MSNARRNRSKSQNNEQNESDTIETDTNDQENVETYQWTTEDKKLLLAALKEFGPANVEAISERLPHIGFHNIKAKMFEYAVRAERKDDLIDKWLNCGLYTPGDSVIPQALLFIQLFEDHPPPSEVGYDFRAIYNYLYLSCVGEEQKFFDLSNKDKELLFSLISKIEKKYSEKDQTNLWEYIGRVYNKRNIKKVYTAKRRQFL